MVFQHYIFITKKQIAFNNNNIFFMSINMNNVYVEAFISEVYRKYQKGSLLSNTVANPKRITGVKAYFPKVDNTIAHKTNVGSPVQYSNANWEEVECILEDWEDPQIVYDAHKPKLNFDEASSMAQNISDSLGRALDQIIINSLQQTTSPDLGGAAQKLTVNLLARISETFNKKGVPYNDRYIAYVPELLTQLLLSDKATSVDYNNVKALVGGQIDSFMGFKFIPIEDRKEGGLPRNYTNKTTVCYAYDKNSVGKAVAEDIKVIVERDATMNGWKHQGTFQIGSVIIDADGVIPFTCNYDNSDLV
jgi:hypothetical protein